VWGGIFSLSRRVRGLRCVNDDDARHADNDRHAARASGADLDEYGARADRSQADR
jgi:hypothetical protein